MDTITINFTAADRYSMIASDRRRAEADRLADRQIAHDSAASARAAEKRAAKRHAINNRPRGQTEIVGRHEDGRPIYRAIPAFRARPYTPPADRKERPEPTIEAVNGWRYNVRPTAERIAAAVKAEAPHETLEERYLAIGEPTSPYSSAIVQRARDLEVKRRARKVRAARIRRQGW